MGSLHERIFSGTYWSYVPYGLAGGLLFLFAFWRLYQDDSMRRISVIIFIGFTCFGSVVVQEFFEHNVNWPDWALGLRVSVEEGTELLGTFLCLLGAGKLLGFNKTTVLSVPERGVESKPYLIVFVSVFLIAAVYATFKAPLLQGYPVRGNPALWFAMAGFLLLAYEQFRGNDLIAVFGNPSKLVILILSLLASLAQTMFVYQRFDVSWLVMATALFLICIASILVRIRKQLLIPMLIVALPMSVLILLSWNGADTAAFMFSIVSAVALLIAHFYAARQSESSC